MSPGSYCLVFPTDYLKGCCCFWGFSLGLMFTAQLFPEVCRDYLKWEVLICSMCCSIDSMACCVDQQWSSSLTKRRTKCSCSFESHPPTSFLGGFLVQWDLFVSFIVSFDICTCTIFCLPLPRSTIRVLFRWKRCIGSMLFAEGGLELCFLLRQRLRECYSLGR